MTARRTFLCALALLVSVSSLGCGNDPAGTTPNAAPEVVKLAICGPMTGGGAAFGEMIRLAAQLKEDEVNSAGGLDVMGKKLKVQIVIEDDQGKAQEATSIARKVGPDKSLCAVVGHFNSDCSLAAKPEYMNSGIVAISPGSTNVNVCQGSDWFFRNLYRDDQQGTFLANFAKTSLKLNKVAVVHEVDNYGTGLKNAFEAEAKAIGLEIVAVETYQRDQTKDFKPHMTKVKQAGAEGVFISGLFNEAALIVKAAREDLGMGAIPFFGGDGLSSDDLIKTAQKSSEGVYVTTPFLFGTPQDTAEAKAFLEAFTKKHGKAPDTWAALTYDAMGQLLQVISKHGTDRTKIKDALAKMTSAETGYKGVTGITYFDANGDCVGKPIYVSMVQDGKFIVSPIQMLGK